MTRCHRIDHRIAAASLAAALAIIIAGSAASAAAISSNAVAVRCTEILKNADVTDGGVAGTGRCTLHGAINDKGKATDYRRKVGNEALIRRVVVGRRGTIAFVIAINLSTGAEPWAMKSGTRAYQGLRGSGRQVVDNWASTPATFVMKGMVSG
jgi:uncharacterized low-complexity protein